MDQIIKMAMNEMAIQVTKSCHFCHVQRMQLASKLRSVSSKNQNYDPPAIETEV